MVDRDLIICGDRRIDIISGLGIGLRYNLKDGADGIEIHFPLSLLPLQNILLALLEPPYPDDVVRRIVRVLLPKLRKLTLLELSGVADDMG